MLLFSIREKKLNNIQQLSWMTQYDVSIGIKTRHFDAYGCIIIQLLQNENETGERAKVDAITELKPTKRLRGLSARNQERKKPGRLILIMQAKAHHQKSQKFHFFTKIFEQGIPLLCEEASALILVKTIAWSCFMEFYVEALHVVQFVGKLFFWFAVDFLENFDVVPINRSITIFFVCGESRFCPLSPSNIAFVFF